jgi:drug/metabolite transporter (DMT)-like permease
MTAIPHVDARAPSHLRGILLMLAAGFLFSCMDATAKHLTQTYPVFEVSWGRYLFHLLTLPLFLGGQRFTGALRSARPGLQLVRSGLLLGATIFFFLAVQHIPLAEATAIGFVSPLLLTALSVPLLSEKVGIRRWVAVLIGLASVLIIIRPGFAAMHWAALLPLATAACFSLYQIATRILSRSDSAATTYVYSAVVGMVATSIIAPFEWVSPDLAGWIGLALLGLIGGLSHFLMIRDFSQAPASLLAPFAYAQLIWATIIGLLWFGDFPDFWTLLGAALITASGIYVVYRERVVARAARRQEA